MTIASVHDDHGALREVFHFLTWTWDVTTGHALAADYPIHHVDITSLAGLVQLIGVNPHHAATADLTRPLLIAPIPDGTLLVIDGWHRITRALTVQVTDLPARLLTTADEARIRLRGT